MIAASLFFLAILSLIAVVVIWWSRKYAREVKQAELTHLPFAPEAPRVTVFTRFLARFPAELQFYFAQQLQIAGVIYLIFSWTFCFLLSSPIFVTVSNSTSVWTDASARSWYLYVNLAVNSGHFLLTLVLLMGILVAGPLRFGAEARFYRTRPIPIRVIFWSRYLPLLIALLAAAATGAALSLLLMYVVRGPIWQHLPAALPAPLPPGPLSEDDADRVHTYLLLLQTSLPRVFLSLLTTMALVFSVITAIFLAPINRWAGRTFTVITLLPGMVAIFIVPMIVNIFADTGNLHYPRPLFIYDMLGPPPPYVYAVVPIALTVAITFIARLFIDRLEA